jgi:hypothetical protein
MGLGITRIPRLPINYRRAFNIKPNFRYKKNEFFEPIFHKFKAEIAAFHPLWVNFWISRQSHDFAQ